MTDHPIQLPSDPVGFACRYLRGGGFRDDGFPIAGLLAMRDDAAEARAECEQVMAERDRLAAIVEAAQELRRIQEAPFPAGTIEEKLNPIIAAYDRLDAALAARAGGGK